MTSFSIFRQDRKKKQEKNKLSVGSEIFWKMEHLRANAQFFHNMFKYMIFQRRQNKKEGKDQESIQSEIVSEYDQEIPQSQTADNPDGTVRKSRSTITRHQEDKLSNAISSLFPNKMIAILEWT